MTSVMRTAVGGMNQSMLGVETAAHNVAHVNTDGYRAQRYDAGTDTVSPRYDASPANPSADPGAPVSSDVDLATEFVSMKQHQIGYRANATMVAVADRMMGELLDILV